MSTLHHFRNIGHPGIADDRRKEQIGVGLHSHRTGAISNTSLQKIGLLVLQAFTLMCLVALTGCANTSVPIITQDDIPSPNIQFIASPTPTFEIPDHDDTDPIANCIFDWPICHIATTVETVDGAPYLGSSLAVLPEQLQSEGINQIFLEADVAVVQGGVGVSEIDVQEQTVAVASPDVGLILTDAAGNPLVLVISSDHGPLFASPDSAEGPAFSIDSSTGEIGIHTIDGDAIAVIDRENQNIFVLGDDPDETVSVGMDNASFFDGQGSGILLNDQEGNPVAGIAVSEGVMAVFEPNGSRVAAVDMFVPGEGAVSAVDMFVPGDGAVSAVDMFVPAEGAVSAVDMFVPIEGAVSVSEPKDNPVSTLSLQGTRIVISDSDRGPVAGLTAGGESQSDEARVVYLMVLIPLPADVSGKVDLTGTMAVYTKDTSGERQDLRKVTVEVEDEEITKFEEVKEEEPVKIPTDTQAKSPPKTEPTKAPPKKTPEPTKSKVKPTATPGK